VKGSCACGAGAASQSTASKPTGAPQSARRVTARAPTTAGAEAFAKPAATTEVTLYTVPAANTSVIKGIRVTNVGSATATVTVRYYLSESASTLRILRNASVAVNETVEMLGNGTADGTALPVIFTAGDVLKVYSSVANTEYLMSYLEMDRT
jgi:hypothetical protein